MISKILIPVDGSTNSFKALEYGIYIVRILDAFNSACMWLMLT